MGGPAGERDRPPRELLPLLGFAEIDVAVEGGELDLRAAAVDGAVRRTVELYAIPAAPGVVVFHHRLPGGGIQLHVEIAVDFAVIALQLDLRLCVGGQRDVDIAVERTE